MLGGRFRFESTSNALLDLVETAFGDLPAHELPIQARRFDVELRLQQQRGAASIPVEPCRVQMQSGTGLVCAVMDASNYTVVAPGMRRALVVASADMLDHPYRLRSELVEFAVFILAARGMGLVALHAACVGRAGRGILLLGASGAGKSTLALHCMLRGCDVLAEDAVFVRPQDLLATGIANYLHLRADALQFLDDDCARRWISSAPVIRRRSGVEKFEADLRRGPGRPAPTPLQLVATVLVSHGRACDLGPALVPLDERGIAEQLSADQPYAASQPGWHRFLQRQRELGVHRLRRAGHPRASVEALLSLLR